MKINHSQLALALLALAVPTFAASPSPKASDIHARGAATQAGLEVAYLNTPLHFESNQGQADASVNFIARGNGFTISLASAEATLVLRNQPSPGDPPSNWDRLSMKVVGANFAGKATAADPLPGKVSYFVGSDARKWRANLPTYAKVRYEAVYPGVDLVYYGNGRQLEFDFILAPGAEPGAIALAFAGADKVEVDEQGNLVLSLPGTRLVQHKPIIYQVVNGMRKEIAGGFKLNDKSEVRFEVGAYDRSASLVIDPVLTYSTYLGGTQTDLGTGIAVDPAGYVYVVGGTSSFDFPVVNAFQPGNGTRPGSGDEDVFVTKFAPDGSVVYSTYFGGSGGYSEGGYAIAADSNGNAYVAGSASADFFGTGTFPTYPVTQLVSGATDAFVAKFDPSGGLVYSRLVGGSNHETALGVAVDGNGSAYVCGWTASADFPTTAGAAQTVFGGLGVQGAVHGIGDGFVAKLNPAGTALEYSTFLGGEDEDLAQGIAVDGLGNAFVTGQTLSDHFPTTPGAFQTQRRGEEDFFVTKLNASGTAWIYSTYLGGSGRDTTEGLHGSPRGIAIDSAGNAYTAGGTTSDDYPTTPGAIQTELRGSPSSCVTKLNASGSALVYSTYLGCVASSRALGIAVDAAGQIYVCGRTGDRFPIVNAVFPNYGLDDGGSNINGYLARLSADGSRLVYSTYLASVAANQQLFAQAVAVDAYGTAYVTGHASFPGFVTTPNAFQATFGGASPLDPTYGDAFVMAIASGAEPPIPTPIIIAPASSIITVSPGRCAAPFRYDVRVEHATGCVEIDCDPPNGTDLILPVGVNTINCRVHDVTGATATNSYSFTVTVMENERPTIICPANVVVHPPCGQNSMVVNFPAPSASDNCSQVTVTCSPNSGSIFPAGTTTVNCTAQDVSGNSASCSFTVTVDTSASIFQFTGFLTPVGGADATGGSFGDPVRTFKLKSTIPVKFKATCDGSPVLTGVHTLQAIKYSSQTTSDTAIDATPTDAATAGNQFRLTGDEWHFNLDTKATGMSAGIWLLRATLSDGSQHTVWVQIK